MSLCFLPPRSWIKPISLPGYLRMTCKPVGGSHDSCARSIVTDLPLPFGPISVTIRFVRIVPGDGTPYPAATPNTAGYAMDGGQLSFLAYSPSQPYMHVSGISFNPIAALRGFSWCRHLKHNVSPSSGDACLHLVHNSPRSNISFRAASILACGVRIGFLCLTQEWQIDELMLPGNPALFLPHVLHRRLSQHAWQ